MVIRGSFILSEIAFMFLQQPAPTGFELRFSVGPFPVEVHPLFWLVGLILVGQSAVSTNVGQPVANLLGAVGLMFVSILIHELGHSVAMAFYGIRSRIVLYALGGMAIPVGSRLGFSHKGMWDQVVIAFAGPLAQFLVLGLLLGAAMMGLAPSPGDPDDAAIVNWALLFWVAVFVNSVWPVLNLLPVLPLDGGRICQGILRMFQGHHQGDISTLWVSVIMGVMLAVFLIQAGFFFFGIFMVMITIQNFQTLQHGSGRW